VDDQPGFSVYPPGRKLLDIVPLAASVRDDRREALQEINKPPQIFV
jgi:hypothetical protein